MSVRSSWHTGAAALLFVLTSALGGLSVLALSGGAGPLAQWSTFGFSQAHEARAFKLLTGPQAADAGSMAAAEAAKALQLSPYNNAARLRLTYVDTLQHGRLTSEGLKRLSESYALIPFDYTVAAWRIRFALEHWEALTPELRAQVIAEATAFGRAGSQDVGVRAVLASIRDPAGRVAAALCLRTLTK